MSSLTTAEILTLAGFAGTILGGLACLIWQCSRIVSKVESLDGMVTKHIKDDVDEKARINRRLSKNESDVTKLKFLKGILE